MEIQQTGSLFATINLPSGAELVEVSILTNNDNDFDFGTFGLVK